MILFPFGVHHCIQYLAEHQVPHLIPKFLELIYHLVLLESKIKKDGSPCAYCLCAHVIARTDKYSTISVEI